MRGAHEKEVAENTLNCAGVSAVVLNKDVELQETRTLNETQSSNYDL